MTTLEIELDTTVLEDEWEYKCVRDFIVENLQKVLDMPYVTCLCCNYGWGGSPAIHIVRHEDLSPEMIAPNDDFCQRWKFNFDIGEVSCIQYSHDTPCGEYWEFRKPKLGEMLMYADCYAERPEVCRVCEGGFVDPVSRGVGQCDTCRCEFFNVEDLEEWVW